MLYDIDKNSKTPLYLQLMSVLIDKIENYMKEHDQLFSERDICEMYDVSRTTVRQAMDELEKEGYIYKVHGKGTFVSARRLDQDLVSFYSFTEEMKKLGKEPYSEIIGFEIVDAGEKLSTVYDVEYDDLMYKITRIRKADNIPMMYETTYLPYDKFEGLTKEQLKNKPLYEVMVSDFNIRLTSADEYFQPILTKKLEGVYLDIPEGAPSLKIERLTYDNNSLIEYTVSITRGDKFKYRVHLNNK